MKIFLDDDRNHREDGWTVVRTVPDLMHLVDIRGAEIEAISFDNDLRQPEEGWHAVREIVDRRVAAQQEGRTFLPALRSVSVHSANREAAANMMGRLEGAARAGYLVGVEIAHLPATGHSYPLAAEDRRPVEVFAVPDRETGSAPRSSMSVRAAAMSAFMAGQGR